MDVDNMLSSLQFHKPDFPLLPKLPPELRAMIWTWALPRPRMVTTSQLTFEQIHQRFGMPNGNFPDLLEFFSDAMTVPCGAFQACRALSPSSATLQPSEVKLRSISPSIESTILYVSVLLGQYTIYAICPEERCWRTRSRDRTCQNGKERSATLQYAVPFGGRAPGTKRRTDLLFNIGRRS